MKLLESDSDDYKRYARIIKIVKSDFEDAERWECGLRGWTYDKED